MATQAAFRDIRLWKVMVLQGSITVGQMTSCSNTLQGDLQRSTRRIVVGIILAVEKVLICVKFELQSGYS